MKIGDKEIVYTASLVVPEGETVFIEFLIGRWRPQFKIDFKNDPDNKSPSRIDIEGQNHAGGIQSLSFVNWNNPMGTALMKPATIGKTNTGQSVFLIAAHWYIGNETKGHVHKVDVHFLLGEEP